MLIVTNGQSAVGALERADVPGAKLSWDDVLHDGPVPAPLDAEALADVRARFLTSCGWGSEAVIRGRLRERDDRLAAAVAQGEEIVLWFEHDLYDQLQLIQVLDRLAGAPRGADRVTLICRARYVSEESADDLRALFPQRRAVTDGQYTTAREAWAAFRSDAPEPLARAARSQGDSLPFLPAALGRQLEEFPGVGDGLSRSERQALAAVHALGGRVSMRELFTVTQRREEPRFLGDASFARYVTGLSTGRSPLLELVESPDGGTISLTESGRAVREGRADWLQLRPIDRWIGGMHLRPGHVWRWDDAAATLLRTLA